jgi:hypothetical protein
MKSKWSKCHRNTSILVLTVKQKSKPCRMSKNPHRYKSDLSTHQSDTHLCPLKFWWMSKWNFWWFHEGKFCWTVCCTRAILGDLRAEHFPTMSGSPKWSLTFRFPHESPVYSWNLLHTCCMTHPSYSSWFYHLNYIRLGIQIIKLLIMYFWNSIFNSNLLGTSILFHNLFSNTLSVYASLNVSDQFWYSYTTIIGGILVLYKLIF